ncbi:MAG: CoA activase [Spirochaetes bacterium]|nr:CoA activase [Spirochaetota bacterium]
MDNDIITAGVDIGSTTSKSLVMKGGEVLAYVIGQSSANPARTAGEVFRESCARAGLREDEVAHVIGTGYGRARVTFAQDNVSEISCHAAGAHSVMPQVRTIIDIGGQDCKAISLDDTGRLKNFAMNDKCAAGTGRFLDVMARVLEVEVERLGELDAASEHPASISNVCSVFAESEVINLINEGASVPDIIRGLHNSLTNRVSVLVNRVGLNPELVVTGGVAKNRGVIRALGDKLGIAITTLDAIIDPQIIGALGAAVIARRRHQKEKAVEAM